MQRIAEYFAYYGANLSQIQPWCSEAPKLQQIGIGLDNLGNLSATAIFLCFSPGDAVRGGFSLSSTNKK